MAFSSETPTSHRAHDGGICRECARLSASQERSDMDRDGIRYAGVQRAVGALTVQLFPFRVVVQTTRGVHLVPISLDVHGDTSAVRSMLWVWGGDVCLGLDGHFRCALTPEVLGHLRELQATISSVWTSQLPYEVLPHPGHDERLWRKPRSSMPRGRG
jgi:hypothetical protein